MVNGAPAKPMSGVSPSSATVRCTASRMGSRAASGSSGRAATSAADRTGCSSTGPRPATMSTPTPASFMGTTMSEKKMAASTPWRRTGCSVISAASAGVRQASSIPVPSRAARYSGRDRPAWRMNHTGRCSAGSPRRVRTSGDSAVPTRRGWASGRAPRRRCHAAASAWGSRSGRAASWAVAADPAGRGSEDSGMRAFWEAMMVPSCQRTPTRFGDDPSARVGPEPCRALVAMLGGAERLRLGWRDCGSFLSCRIAPHR